LGSIDREINEWNKTLNGDWPSPPQPAKPTFKTFGKAFEDRFQDLKGQEDQETKSYSTETSTTTHITRAADGSVHEETTTTERLPDGTTKTTKLVKTPEGETRTETIVNKPVIKERFRELSRADNAKNGSSGAETRVTSPPAPMGGPDNKGNGDAKNWAWWFWSRK
jgi:hypothetical protein